MAIWNRSRTIAVGGVVTALVLAGGGIALASSPSDTTTTGSSSASTPTTATRHGRINWRRIAARVEHGQFVVRTKSGAATRDLIDGTVSAVSPSSVTVRAADGTDETFAVTAQTKVRVRENRKGSPSSIGAVAVGDHVLVLGTGTALLTANRVIDLKG